MNPKSPFLSRFGDGIQPIRFIFVLAVVVPHMKFLWILSIWLLTWAGSLIYCITWLGMRPRDNLARVVLPAMFMKWVFQPASLVCILSMMNWKSLLVGLLWNIGNFRYLPKDLLAVRVTDFDWKPTSINDVGLNASRQSLHAHDIDVGRHRVSLPNAPARVEKVSSAPIH